MSSLQEQEDAFCGLLDAAAEYLKLRDQLDQLLKAGHLNIARARYAMSPGAIGQTSYSSDMQATLRAETAITDPQPFRLTQQGLSEVSARVMQRCHDDEQKGDGQASQDATPATSERRHHAKAGVQGTAAGTEQVQSETASEYSSNAIAELAAKFDKTHVTSAQSGRVHQVSDPLRWFGFMVPPPLRQAQVDFRTAAILSIQLANIQHKIYSSLNIMDTADYQSEQDSV